MPPKASSATWPPRRTARTTARKTVPTVITKRTSSPKNPASPSFQNSTNNPPLYSASATFSASTTAATVMPSPELPQSASATLTSLDNKSTLQKENLSPAKNSSHASSYSRTQIKTPIPMSGAEVNVGGASRQKSPLNSGSSGPEVAAPIAGDGNLVGSGTKSTDGDGHVLESKDNDATVVEGEKTVFETGGSSSVAESGKRKKKVKVVKKVVKRIVLKKVPKGSLQRKEVESVDNVNNLNEKIGISEHEMNCSQLMEVKNFDPTAIVSQKIETFKPNHSVSLEEKNEGLKETEVDSVEVEKESFPVKDTAGGENMETEGENEGLNEIEVDSVEVEKVIYPGSDTAEGENMKSSGVSESGISSGVQKAGNNDGKQGESLKNQVENQNVVSIEMDGGDAVENQTAALEQQREQSRASEGEEAVKKPVENPDIGLNGGIALSGEMEALERRRRRRTEIFLGGLDKDAREEDIRKVFEQVGEVTEVRLVKNNKTGKNKGFAFLRFSSAADAKKALEKYSKVEICGKQCGAELVGGNDTLFLGNINKKWKHDDVVKLLKDAGIEKIDKVTLVPDPQNLEQNRGFAFVELETSKHAQIVFNKLQKNDDFIKKMKIKVAWAQPLAEPDEKEMLKVKSVYAEYLPSLWDEEKVRHFFERFGEIESIILAKNLPSSRRKDFAFINYSRRDDACACIEAFSHEQTDDDGSKVKVRVSLAKPLTKVKHMKHVPVSTGNKPSKDKTKAVQSIIKVHEPGNKGTPARSSQKGTRVDASSTTTDELLRLLRQQASGGLTRPGSSDLNYNYSSPGNKRPYSALGYHPVSSDPRGFPRTRLESSHLTGSPSAFPHHVNVGPLHYSQQRNTGYAFESSYGIQNYPRFQARERDPYFGHGGIYRR